MSKAETYVRLRYREELSDADAAEAAGYRGDVGPTARIMYRIVEEVGDLPQPYIDALDEIRRLEREIQTRRARVNRLRYGVRVGRALGHVGHQ